MASCTTSFCHVQYSVLASQFFSRKEMSNQQSLLDISIYPLKNDNDLELELNREN